MLGKNRREQFGGFVAGRDIVFYKQVETEEQERDNRDLLTMYYQTGIVPRKKKKTKKRKKKKKGLTLHNQERRRTQHNPKPTKAK